MTSTIKVDTIQNSSGTTGISINSNGVITTPAKPMFKAKGAENITLTNNTLTTVQFNSTEFDVGGYFNTSTYRYTPLVAGKYFIYAKLYLTYATEEIEFMHFYLNKNGSGTAFYSRYASTGSIYGSVSVSSIVDMNGSSDYLDTSIRVTTTTNSKYYANDIYGEFSGFLIS